MIDFTHAQASPFYILWGGSYGHGYADRLRADSEKWNKIEKERIGTYKPKYRLFTKEVMAGCKIPYYGEKANRLKRINPHKYYRGDENKVTLVVKLIRHFDN